MDLMKEVSNSTATHFYYYYLIFNGSLIEGYEYFHIIENAKRKVVKRKLKVNSYACT